MKHFQGSIRFFILLFSVFLSALIFIYAYIDFKGSTQLIKLTQLYAFIALLFLYAALIIEPLQYSFKQILPFNTALSKTKSALGVAAFYFAFLHFCIAFFGQLGGFSGLFYLSERYFIGVTFSFIALSSLFFMAVVSFLEMFRKVTEKKLRRFHWVFYVAGLLVIIHMLMLGTHFSNLSSVIPVLFYAGVALLLLLESLRLDGTIRKRVPKYPKIGMSFVSTVLALVFVFAVYFAPSEDGTGAGLNVHAEHLRQMQEDQNARIQRVSVDFSHPEVITAGEETPLRFTINNEDTPEQITSFRIIHEELLHLIIVDSTLSHFDHQHPELIDGVFRDSIIFPNEGKYFLYLDFQPTEGREQQKMVTATVGTSNTDDRSIHTPDRELTKTVGAYTVTLLLPDQLTAEKMTGGEQAVTFRFREKASGRPVSDLRPYLGAFGHMVMIHKDSYAYLHVHPADEARTGQTGGPDVSFYPTAITEPIQPGIYRVFGQFNPGGELLTVDFTVEVK